MVVFVWCHSCLCSLRIFIYAPLGGRAILLELSASVVADLFVRRAFPPICIVPIPT